MKAVTTALLGAAGAIGILLVIKNVHLADTVPVVGPGLIKLRSML